jgi:hypothetical protein
MPAGGGGRIAGAMAPSAAPQTVTGFCCSHLVPIFAPIPHREPGMSCPCTSQRNWLELADSLLLFTPLPLQSVAHTAPWFIFLPLTLNWLPGFRQPEKATPVAIGKGLATIGLIGAICTCASRMAPNSCPLVPTGWESGSANDGKWIKTRLPRQAIPSRLITFIVVPPAALRCSGLLHLEKCCASTALKPSIVLIRRLNGSGSGFSAP